MANKDARQSTFIIYYLNYSKAIELCMTMDNLVQKTKTVTKETERARSRSAKVGAGASLPASSALSAEASLDVGLSSDKTNSFAEARTYEVKHTKSTYLKRIVQHAKWLGSCAEIEGVAKGSLVCVDGVSLSPCNQGELAQMQLLRHDMLKGFRVQGIDVNNMISSMLEDYSYVLIAEGPSSGNRKQARLAVKIPSENSNEFESKYRIHDLLLGEVSLLGVYKGAVNARLLTHTTFDTLQEMGAAHKQEELSGGGVIKSAVSELPSEDAASSEGTAALEGDIHYLDLIAIIQHVDFDGTFPDENKDPVSGNAQSKLGLWESLRESLTRRFSRG